MNTNKTKKREIPDNFREDTWADRVHRVRCELSNDELPIAMRELAELLGITPATILCWENGHHSKPIQGYRILFNNLLVSKELDHLVWK